MSSFPTSGTHPTLRDETVSQDIPRPMTSIEKEFPAGELWRVARRESWRKEIYRPLYHLHKWWATRLGSVFRAIVLGSLQDSDANIWKEFYERHSFSDRIVLDPFMGSGTTIGEALKLGARAIGCDVNPISSFVVQQALTCVTQHELDATYLILEQRVAKKIRAYYKTIDRQDGQTLDVLYYFWVKEVKTPSGEVIPLFSDYVFAKDAYPDKKPVAAILCPKCGAISRTRHDVALLKCVDCGNEFSPHNGPAKGQFVVDSRGQKFRIKELVSAQVGPPTHRMYAILAVRPNGEKVYLRPSEYDFDLYASASRQLALEDLPLPTQIVRPGHNTDQARGYNYRYWREFFNDRQLLSLGWLLKEILGISDLKTRDQFLCLFSSALEFNNLFCSFKGEGTGAVRHMFSHHILKPERAPLENNVWGTPHNSGAFSTLYRSRLIPAKAYLNAPFELAVDHDLFEGETSSRKLVCSASIDTVVTNSWKDFSSNPQTTLILNGDSACIPIPDNSVDAVVTDPPYFDFVHYSELSDFFFAWLKPVLRERYQYFDRPDSSHEREVQDADPQGFSQSLTRVLGECCRVLKSDGVLVFTFHHSRPEGWLAVYQAIRTAGLRISATHVIHAELSVASPKKLAKEPISLDSIIVCRHREHASRYTTDSIAISDDGAWLSKNQLTQGDRFVIAAAQILRESSVADLRDTEVEAKLSAAYADHREEDKVSMKLPIQVMK